jgi:hypothetical protein
MEGMDNHRLPSSRRRRGILDGSRIGTNQFRTNQELRSRRAARVGEHSEVEWNCVYRSPAFAIRSSWHRSAGRETCLTHLNGVSNATPSPPQNAGIPIGQVFWPRRDLGWASSISTGSSVATPASGQCHRALRHLDVSGRLKSSGLFFGLGGWSGQSASSASSFLPR